MPVRSRSAVPELVSCTVWGALVEPAARDGKVTLVGESVTAGAGMVEVPVSATETEPPLPLS